MSDVDEVVKIAKQAYGVVKPLIHGIVAYGQDYADAEKVFRAEIARLNKKIELLESRNERVGCHWCDLKDERISIDVQDWIKLKEKEKLLRRLKPCFFALAAAVGFLFTLLVVRL